MPYDPVLDRHLDEADMATVREMPYGEQEAYLLAVTERMTVEEIGQRLRRPARAISMRLYRARLRLHAALPEKGAGGLPALLLTRLRNPRRQGLGRWPRHLAEVAMRLGDVAPATQLSLVAVVMAALVTGPSSSLPAPAAGTAVFGAASARVRTADAEWFAPATSADRMATPEAAPPRHPAVSAGEAAGVIGGLAAGHTAATETPDDTQLVAAAAAAQPAAPPVVVAIGVGKTCVCSVLYRSTDGGATWTASAAPPGSNQIVLPPAYPADPQIFLGASAATTSPDYVLARFGGEATPLPGPPGQLAAATDSATGALRVFVASRFELWSVDPARWRPQVDLTYPGASDVARIATEGDHAVVVAVPASPASAVLGWPALAAPKGMYACSATEGAACDRLGDGPAAGVGGLSAAPAQDVDPTVAAVANGSLSLSTDGGRTFAPVALPAGTPTMSAVAVADHRVWSVFALANNAAFRLEWFDVVTRSWHDVTAADHNLQKGDVVAVAPGGTTLDLLVGGGLRCSGDGGASWAARCPSATTSSAG